ncbi:MAG: hypothetical protein JNL01_14265 [Bdellovibrionales bacterium]|nr:hypothetical protein [Bdellovibrionales bacterium]
MSIKYFDVVVAKDYEIEVEGKIERKTAWNKVGRAWETKSQGAYNFELFHIPGIRYLLFSKDRAEQTVPRFDEVPF